MRIISFVLAAMMILTSLPINTFAETGAAASQGASDQKGKNYDIVPMDKDYINGLGVKVAKPGANEKAEDFIKNPDQPKIYTLRTDYKTQKGDKYEISYQPYIASVGEAASKDEKAKINKTIELPELSGYEKPQDDFVINYKNIVDAAKDGQERGNKENGLKYSTEQEHKYKAKINTIKIKHVFQDLEDFSKYTNPDGTVGEKGELITTQNGNTGSTMEVSPYEGEEAKGFVPEANAITMQVPENTENFILEYRYNRAHYDVVFDTQDGTSIPTRTLYYEQVIPKLDKNSVPTKVGSVFQGWMPSVDLKTKDGKKYKANDIIKDGTDGAIKDLDANLIMPDSKVTFTAVWKDKEKADYAIQFWAEKADHAEGASLMDKYDYMGTRVYKDKDTGTRPDLNAEPVNGLKFPDLDQARLNKIWANARFNRGHDLYLNKFYVYNQALTADQNKDPKIASEVKPVKSTGKTVYNIYYDRQVYDLYFTKSNAQPEKNTIYPEIWGYDKAEGEAVMKGGPGNLYHYKARFNEIMYKWPNDAKQTKGFTPGYQSFGWGPNYTKPNFPLHLDTPPYRLNADEFLDMGNYTNWGGYTKHIDKGDGTTIDLDPFDFTTLSFGIKQDNPSIPHHMDFWMDGFKDGETIIRYDLVRTKADTAGLGYGHRYPKVLGFTPYGYNPRAAWPAIAEGSEENGRVNEDEINELNDERDEITPNNCGTYYNNFGTKLPIGQLEFISSFFSDSDEFGDVKEGGQSFEENGYLRFKYTRNKYPLRFNYDPSIIRDDSYFNSKNQLDTFYEFPLKALSPDVDSNDEYKKVDTKEGPKNLLDNPENLQKLGLTDLVFTDPKDGKLKVKRPDDLSDQMVFKGWAIDPAGTKLIWENKGETMPTHPLNLYAKWGEPDYKWKVTFDPDGGELKTIDETKLTTELKTIQEGDIGKEEVNTYAKKGYLKEPAITADGKQIFTVIQRQKLVEPAKPTKKGYDFMGWEVIRYNKNQKGDYTNEVDTSYRDTYKVPELYTFGNDVVSPIYLKAIWVPNQRVDVTVEHYFLKDYFTLDTSMKPNPKIDILAEKRANYLVATTGDKQDEKYILARHEDIEENLKGKYKDKNGKEYDLKTVYEEYNERVKLNNSFFQTFRVEPEKIKNQETGKMEDNPKVVNNVFKFFYRPFRTRDYKVNYIDERGKKDIEKFFKGLELTDTSTLTGDELLEANKANKEKFEAKKEDFEKLIKKYQVIEPEAVSNGNRHYDARNYRRIPGWVLAENEKPQQQLFFDVNETTNAFLGINGTGSDQIFFYYKDVRVIEVPGDKEPPKGYVRVTFKADKGGSFGKDKDGKDITELHYDVIQGLKSDLLPVPEELKDGEEKVADKYYITPETGKKFIKWDEKPLLNKNTIVDNDKKDFYVFTAKFEWSGLSASGLVRTEAFKDPNNKWTNDFAPKIEDLKKQLVWMEKGKVEKLPAGAVIKLYDEAGNELTSDDQVYDLAKEIGKADKDQLVRTVNIKAKVTFKDGKDPQELDIPIKVYKNVYEALTGTAKPLFLSEAEKGDLKDITGDYIKVTVAPTGEMKNKDNKVYYVNKNAWVEIPEVSPDNSSFINWTADQVKQNDDGKANGVFDFKKRHKFTEDTVISPRFSQTSELVVHESFKDAKGNWVNNFIATDLKDEKIKEAIEVRNGKAMALGADDKITIVDDAGKEYESDDALNADLYKKLQEKYDGSQASRTETIKVRVTFANGEVQTVTVPIKVIKNIYEAKTKTEKPYYVPSEYVKVTVDPTTKAQDPQRTYFYVNPDAKVLIPGKDPVGVKEAFTRWTMKKDSEAADVVGEKYELKERHQFEEDSTIIAQYEEGKVKIIYVDENKKEIDPKYHIDGEDYPTEKFGKLNRAANDSDFGDPKVVAPKFKGYLYSSRDAIKGKKYKDPADPNLDIVKYYYYKKVTTDTPLNPNPYFPVIFDANTGEFESNPKDKKTVYVYFDGNDATVEKVTFKEVRQAVEEKFGKPSKVDENFLEWQDKKKSGSAVDDAYEIQFKGWNWDADPDNGYVPEIFYANYGKASALIKYLDLNGKPIADEFKISTEKYPTEKAGTADEAIPSDVFTKDTAPKLTGYKFNRIELNPKDGKYALSNKATIKIYYEKDLDVIPAKDGSGNPNEKPDGYVEVKFVPTKKAKDNAEKIFYVNPKKEVTIPIANPEAKATFKFKEWKMGANADGAVYNPGTPKKFTDVLTVITATYTSTENIIPYDPSVPDPMPRPEGYVRVSFTADPGLTLTEQKAYYVKANAGITLGNADLKKPGYTVETGYKFDKWDPADTTIISDKDIVVTAKATELKDVDTVERPGYVKVTFKADTNGEIRDEHDNKIEKKVYYVNPKKYVRLDAPKPVGNTGYDFVAWSSNKVQGDFSLANYINYTEDTIITAMFNQKDAVYPKLDGTKKPDGYVEVTFVINSKNGKFAENEVTTYYVDPSREVSLKAPNTVAGTGYIFDGWRFEDNTTAEKINLADRKQYKVNTTIYGSFTKIKDIIPARNDDGTSNLQPTDYVAVLFIEGDHAKKVDGKTLYYVNPKAGKKLREVTKPTIIPDTGWKHTGWDTDDETEITDYTFVVAQYEERKSVIPKTTNDDSEKPDGYVTVTFKAGDNGALDGGEKVYYVNPNVYVKLDAPNPVPKTGFVFGSWKSDGKVFSLDNYIKYEHDTTITANFNSKGDVIPKTKQDESEKPAGFVTVNFVIEGKGGKIEDREIITYFVKPNTAVTIHPPKTKAYTGYEFEKWSPDTTVPTPYKDEVTTIKGSFKKLDDIIKSKEANGTINAKPDGYVTVQYLKGEHGVLDGQTTFYVNPKAGKTLNDLKPLNITVVPAPTYKFANWDKPDTTAIDKPLDVTAEYTQLPNIIKAGPKDTAPAGYVVIIFETDGRGTITGNVEYEEDKNNPAKNETEIVYFVNPKKGVTLADATATASQTVLPVPSTTPDDATKYRFDQWRKDIDKTTPIIRGRVHIAMFKPKEVKLIYDANGATEGTAPAEVKVDYGTSVRLAHQGDLKKKDARFAGWTIDRKDYKVGDQITLIKDTTAYAKWTTDDTIIKYNPNATDPIPRPDDTYVRVRFAVDNGLELKEFKAYYVKKDAGILLGDEKLVKPGYNVEIGYKFDKWDKDNNLEITTDVLVTAKAIKLDTVVPEKDKNGQPNAKPEGYKEVVFVVKDEDMKKGSLEGVTKFYVNPTEYVTINQPATKANTGFEFGAWDKDSKIPTVYKEDTTIIGSFNGLNDIIPKTNPDGTENKKPAGYKTVTFVIEGQGGSIVKDQVTVYYVNPDKEVTVPQPRKQAETGYEFDKWKIEDQEFPTEAKKYTEDTTVKGSFKKLKDIIPSTDPTTGKANAQPDGYVKVTFEKGEHGKDITGQTVYYVNPNADPVKTLGDTTIVKPELKAEVGYEFTGWDKNDDEEIKDNTTVTAQYTELPDVIVKTADNDSQKPDGYITVTFDTTNKGRIKNTSMITKTVLFVNPNKAHVLRKYAPEVTPKTGYDFADWDTQIDKKIQYSDGDTIKALYNTKGDLIPQEKTDGSDKPAGYVIVLFDKGDHGRGLDGKTVYYVNPNKEVTVPAPKVNAAVGYKFTKWDKELTQTFTENTRITAEYTTLDNIIPQEKTDESDKPYGYNKVTFLADANGSLIGKTVYYVNPEQFVNLKDKADAITKKANLGYTEKDGKWTPAIETKKYTSDEEYVFNFKKLDDVIPKTKEDESEKPEGYVKVTLKPTDKATDDTKAEKVYFVNPKKEVTIKNKPEGKKETINEIEYTYTFTGWTVTRGTIASWADENINGQFIQETEITAKYSTKVDLGKVLPSPVPKKDVVTAKGDTPSAEDLIKNIPGSENNPLPEGTEINYTDDGKPDVNNPGKTTAKVEVKYPNGKTVVVEVPITVVDNVVTQIGNDKPLVPGSYVKVTVDTTDKATDNTKFTKVFWVKPGVTVTIPGILAPTGKPETDTNGVTNTNNFKKWKLVGSNPEKFYDNEIKDTFKAKESIIVATYEQDKNVEPVGKDDQWIPQKSTPEAKDFIKNRYDDSNPNIKDNLPPGTRFDFAPGTKPDTSEQGEGETTIIVTYPNGEVKEIVVPYKVTGDVVEQNGNKKPIVPDNFVKVVVDTTDFATRETYSFKTYWVNPDKIVKIPADTPKGTKDEEDHRIWLFEYWQADSEKGDGKQYRDVIEDLFTKDTYIKAYYYKAEVPVPGSDYVVTDLNKLPTKEEYLKRIKKPADPDKKIADIRVVKEPNVRTPGRTYATIDVIYDDGTSVRIDVQVYVLKPGETNFQIIYRDRIVEKEKIVEKIIKIKDNQRLKEVRFMQGFEGKFRPHDGLTRAEAAQILANALKQDGYKYNPAYPINYKDVKQKWYTQAIVITTQANVFKGYDDGYFRPEEKISRAEWIATLKRFQQLKDADGNRMGLKANHWATREVEAAYEEGWLQIYTNGNAKFNANEPITREEVAAVTNKAFGRLIDRTYIMRNDKSVINYKDINPSMWSYVDILCASNSFIHDENVYMSHGIEYIKTIVNNIEGTIIFNVQLKNLEIIQDKFQRYLR